MLFRDELEAKLLEFNPWLTEDQARAIVDTIEALPATIEGNREVLAWMRGERSGTTRTRSATARCRSSTSTTPTTTTFIVTWEWKIEPLARKGNRADVMFVVNGIPVAIVEHKNPKDGDALDARRQAAAALREGDARAARRSRSSSTSPTCSTTGTASRGTPTAASSSSGSRRADEAYRFAVQAFFEPTDFLRTLQHWILFYVEDGETRKSVLREHQRRAIDTDRRALRRLRQEPRPDLAHPGLGQDLHAADRGPADPRGQGPLQERDRHPRRRPH